MKTVIIVQARMASTRLPGKILKEVMGKTLLEYQIERLHRVRLVDQIVIATTDQIQDQPIVDLCIKLNVPHFRGSEMDVLERYYGASLQYNADSIVRVTSDCPLIDPAVIDRVLEFYQKHHEEYDYVTNTLEPEHTYPRGMDTEVFSFRALQEAYFEATDQPEREHVTVFIKRRPERYRLANVPYYHNYSNYRWTVDTPEDFELISKIISNLCPLKPCFTLEDCLALLKEHPEWTKINRNIIQKKVL